MLERRIQKIVKEVIVAYVLIAVANKILMEIYMNECVGRGLEVIVKSIRIVSTECKMMRWIIYNGGNKIEMIWLVLIKNIMERIKEIM